MSEEPEDYKLIPPEPHGVLDGIRSALRVMRFVFLLVLGVAIVLLYRGFAP
jgi:hypothetical protein